MNSIPTSIPGDVRPLDGWKVQTKYGTLKTRRGVLLVLLEDIHLWMCGNGVPARDAIYMVFGPFLEACLGEEGCNTEAAALPETLQLLNAVTFPDGLFRGAVLGPAKTVAAFANVLPELEHVRFHDGTMGGLVYAIAEGAKRVWHGVADLQTDPHSLLNDKRSRAEESRYGYSWPADDDLRKLLGRVAVPIETAYALWGWGSVSEVVQLRSVPLAASEPTTWATLVAFRKEKADERKKPEWTVSHKKILRDEFKRLSELPGASHVAETMAALLPGEDGKTMSISRFNKLKATADEQGKRRKKAA